MKRSEQQTNALWKTASKFASFPLHRKPRSRYLLRSEKGFLQASHSLDGPPIKVIPTPEGATTFVDFITAVRRAQALSLLGWRELRVVEHLTPL